MKYSPRVGPIESVRAIFFDLFAVRSPWMKALYRMVAEEVTGRLEKGRILDLGCGPGILPVEMAKRAPALEVVGVDLSKDMVRIARRNAAKAGIGSKVSFEEGRAERLPFPDGSFDMVVSTVSFHHWEDREAGLKEVRRVLKKGGEGWLFDLWADAPPEKTREFLSAFSFPYRLLGRLVFHFVKIHSSLTKEYVSKAVLSALGDGARVEGRTFFLKIVIAKG